MLSNVFDGNRVAQKRYFAKQSILQFLETQPIGKKMMLLTPDKQVLIKVIKPFKEKPKKIEFKYMDEIGNVFEEKR